MGSGAGRSRHHERRGQVSQKCRRSVGVMELSKMSCRFIRPNAWVARWRLGLSVALAVALGGCSMFERTPPKGSVPSIPPESAVSGDKLRQTVPGLPAFGKDARTTVGSRLGVNNFLWRGALDTISFMPLVSADPFGGVIITDWYAPPETPQERFKLNVYITGQELRADALKVAVFHQRQVDGQWQEAASDQGTATQLEDTILTRAESLRRQALGGTSG